MIISAPGFAAHLLGSEVVLASGSVAFGSHGIFAAAEGTHVELVKLAEVGGFAAAKAIGWKVEMGDAPPHVGPSSALRSRLGLPASGAPPPGPPLANPPALRLPARTT